MQGSQQQATRDNTPFPRRVLMIGGAEFTDSVVFRYTRHLRQRQEDLRFSAIGIGAAGGSSGGRQVAERLEEAFERSDPFPRWELRSGRLTDKLRIVSDLIFAPRVTPLEISLKGRVRERLNWGYAARSLTRFWRGYDLYHWHCFDPYRLGAVRFLPADARLIISLWGSDLYRTAGVSAYKRQLDACRRATVLTVGSLEMRETFLAKFGWEWEPKIRIVNYGSELATVSSARPLKDRFRLEHNIPAERICVCVGNSASVGNQHLRVLAALARMSPEKLARLVVVVPMTYGATPAYLEQVRRAAQAHPATVVLLERFLTDAESAALRWSTDVLVHVPVSDQFSASMCESIYAGSVLITGAWLPYSRLRLAGIPYHELEDIACLPERLDAILDDIESERQRAIAAAPKMWDLMAWESVIPRWIRLYREILDKKENGDIECRQ